MRLEKTMDWMIDGRLLDEWMETERHLQGGAGIQTEGWVQILLLTLWSHSPQTCWWKLPKDTKKDREAYRQEGRHRGISSPFNYPVKSQLDSSSSFSLIHVHLSTLDGLQIKLISEGNNESRPNWSANYGHRINKQRPLPSENNGFRTPPYLTQIIWHRYHSNGNEWNSIGTALKLTVIGMWTCRLVVPSSFKIPNIITTLSNNLIIAKITEARGHPFITSTRRGEGVRLRWTHVDGGRGGSSPMWTSTQKIIIRVH